MFCSKVTCLVFLLCRCYICYMLYFCFVTHHIPLPVKEFISNYIKFFCGAAAQTGPRPPRFEIYRSQTGGQTHPTKLH